MPSFNKSILQLLIVILFVLPTSGVVQPSNTPTTFAQNNRLSVVATTTIIADVIQNVVGDTADITSLMGPNQDPHSFQPTANDIIVLDDADVVFVNGANFEEGLVPILEEASNNILEISACVEILPFGGHDHDEEGEDHDEEHSEADEDHEHDDEMTVSDSHFAEICDAHHAELEGMMDAEEHDEDHEHAEETLGILYTLDCGEGHEGEEDHAHEAGGCDPHTWGDIHNVMLWTLFVRDTLSELDPINAEVYAANAAAYIEALYELDEELTSLVNTIPLEDRLLVTNHDSFAYLAHYYDMEIIGTVIPSASTTAEPSPSDVLGLIEIIQDNDVPAIFTENTVSDDIAEQIADETGASIFRLYTGSLSDSDGDAPTYIDYMRYNVTTIVTGLSQ